MPTDREVAAALEEARAVKERIAKAEAGALRRAVSDVMDGTLTLNAAYKAHGVGEVKLREALRDAGWVPPAKSPRVRPVRRRTFGSGKRHGT